MIRWTAIVSTALVLVTLAALLYWPTVQKLREDQAKVAVPLPRFPTIENFSDRR